VLIDVLGVGRRLGGGCRLLQSMRGSMCLCTTARRRLLRLVALVVALVDALVQLVVLDVD
jgi:hypothetical protein